MKDIDRAILKKMSNTSLILIIGIENGDPFRELKGWVRQRLPLGDWEVVEQDENLCFMAENRNNVSVGTPPLEPIPITLGRSENSVVFTIFPDFCHLSLQGKDRRLGRKFFENIKKQ